MTWKSTNQDSTYLGIFFHRIWGEKVGITYYYTYGLFFCTSLNSYEFLVTRATTTTRELHMLRQLYCYFVTLGAFLRNICTK